MVTPAPATHADAPDGTDEVATQPGPLPEGPIPRCANHWFQAVYNHTRGAVVAVEVNGQRSAGFVFQVRRHVVTTFDAVRHGVEFTVIRQDGVRMPARVVATDPAHDLAILDTRVAIPDVNPIQAGSEVPLEVGDPVMLLGLSEEADNLPSGLVGFRAAGSAGRVHTPPGGDIEFDASVHGRNVGGPLLTCDGRILGVARRASSTGDVGLASPIGHLLQLTGAIGHQGRYHRNWEFSYGLHVVWQGGDGLHGTHAGGMVSLGAVYRRWLGLQFRGTLQGMNDTTSQVLTQYSSVLTSAALVADWRIPFNHFSGIALGLGVDATLPALTTRTSTLAVGGATAPCTPGVSTACPVYVGATASSTTNNNVVLPMAEVELQFGMLSLYGSLETDFSQVQGRFAIGIAN